MIFSQVQDRLKKAKNRALANKIKVMKIKGSAVGDNRVPVADRLFFAVAPPLSGKESVSAKSIFFSKEWTLGKCDRLLSANVPQLCVTLLSRRIINE